MGVGDSSMFSHFNHATEENNLDPDDGNSILCRACRLPIFSTPFITTVDRKSAHDHRFFFMHDQCANLPKTLEGHPNHPGKALVLHEDNNLSDNVFYKCPDSFCGFELDVLSSTTIKILHRSHPAHRLMVIRGPASFVCGFCGTQHESGMSDMSYLCNLCGFWLHPHCASLPNAVILSRHTHPLLLVYAFPHEFFPGDLKSEHSCEVCGGIIQHKGVYFCRKCSYYVHIKCAISDPQSFMPVLIRDANIPDMLHLPLANERTSLMRSVIENTTSCDVASSSCGHDDEHDNFLHEHTLIFHDMDDNVDDNRICDACVRLISPPFYSCSQCTNFFLHSCCVNLPRAITHPAHWHHGPLTLVPKPNARTFKFTCESCRRPCNGFAYSCKACDDFNLDVACALSPPLITHEAHNKAHILYFEPYNSRQCQSCSPLGGWGYKYECRTCRKFELHAPCAFLPNTVRHKFDRHPLKLTTAGVGAERKNCGQEDEHFCEICEMDMESNCWYYRCDQCDQSFHIRCIPAFDDLSNIKFGFNVSVPCHDCPVTGVRALSVAGYPCAHCARIIREYDEIAFECSECCFWIHGECAEKLWLESEE
ncbi:hypothetical protein CASFOL_025420 [Castilleja foliolosa]|uniref:Phorbol-ester/DAG-type domain-containing protein n=1 Tax=Castilleja foliolosa TaxID=1961234 RepID=A0ABD3CR21_9LAMI